MPTVKSVTFTLVSKTKAWQMSRFMSELKKHKNALDSSASSAKMTSFFKPVIPAAAPNKLDEDVHQAEVLWTNFCIEHNIAPNVAEHYNKL